MPLTGYINVTRRSMSMFDTNALTITLRINIWCYFCVYCSILRCLRGCFSSTRAPEFRAVSYFTTPSAHNKSACPRKLRTKTFFSASRKKHMLFRAQSASGTGAAWITKGHLLSAKVHGFYFVIKHIHAPQLLKKTLKKRKICHFFVFFAIFSCVFCDFFNVNFEFFKESTAI